MLTFDQYHVFIQVPLVTKMLSAMTDSFQKKPVVAAFVAPTRQGRLKHFKRNGPIFARHLRAHADLQISPHAMNQTKLNRPPPISVTYGNPSKQPSNGLLEEMPRYTGIPVLKQHEIKSLTVPITGSIEISLFNFNLYIGFTNVPKMSRRMLAHLRLRCNLKRVSDNPSVQRCHLCSSKLTEM